MRRIVVKVGSAVLTKNDSIALDRMKTLVEFLWELKKNNEIILVSSGSVSAGYTRLQLDRSILSNKQALAAIGQPILMHHYHKKFSKFDIITSQVLVTSANLHRKEDIKRIKNTINTLLKKGVIPIINENDATATEELEVGDNDQLSAYIANHTDSEMLIILSDIDAYYDDDPRENSNAKALKVVHNIPASDLSKTATPHNIFATGGIVTKLKAANYLVERDKDMFLASGFNLADVKSFMLDNIHKGGTLFTKGC